MDSREGERRVWRDGSGGFGRGDTEWKGEVKRRRLLLKNPRKMCDAVTKHSQTTE